MRASRPLATGVLLLAALGLLWGMQRTTPNYTRLLAPIESRGDPGQFVRGRSVEVRVDGVEFARSLQLPRFDGIRTLASSGVWLIVHASASAVGQPQQIAAAAIESADGLRYVQSDRVSLSANPLSSKTLQPGLVSSGDFIFELSSGELAGADLLLSAAPFGLAPLDSVLRIRLRIEGADLAQRMAALPETYVLKAP